MLVIDHLTTYWDQQQYQFNLSIKQGSLVAITGVSGVGKSTLLRMIAGFVPIFSGKLLLDQTDFTNWAPSKRPVSLLFQEHNLFDHLSVKQNLALGLTPNLWKITKDHKTQIHQMLEQLQLTHKINAKPWQLSGGQAQRIALGRTLLRRQPILLLDEPFSSLDPDLRSELIQLTKNIHHQNKLTTLMVSHHPDEVRPFVDEIIQLPCIMSCALT